MLQYERVSAALPKQALSDGSLPYTPLLAPTPTALAPVSLAAGWLFFPLSPSQVTSTIFGCAGPYSRTVSQI